MNEDGVNSKAKQTEGQGQQSSGNMKDKADDIWDEPEIKDKLREVSDWVRGMKDKVDRRSPDAEHPADVGPTDELPVARDDDRAWGRLP